MTCPEVGDNGSKGLLIPHVVVRIRGLATKGIPQGISLWEGSASHQLVGEVEAHQGDDG